MFGNPVKKSRNRLDKGLLIDVPRITPNYNYRIRTSYEGDRMEHDLVLLIACDTLLQILIVADAALGLKARDMLRKAHEDLTALVGRTWDTLFKDPTVTNITDGEVVPDGG
jgi:hypothetical protein